MRAWGRKQVVLDMDSQPGDIVTVQTRNNRYFLEVIDPAEGLVRISGGSLWTEPAEGIVVGGHIQEDSHLLIGMMPSKTVVTTTLVRWVKVERA